MSTLTSAPMAIDAHKQSIPVLLKEAEASEKTGNLAAAIQIYKQALATASNDSNVLTSKLSVNHSIGDALKNKEFAMLKSAEAFKALKYHSSIQVLILNNLVTLLDWISLSVGWIRFGLPFPEPSLPNWSVTFLTDLKPCLTPPQASPFKSI